MQILYHRALINANQGEVINWQFHWSLFWRSHSRLCLWATKKRKRQKGCMSFPPTFLLFFLPGHFFLKRGFALLIHRWTWKQRTYAVICQVYFIISTRAGQKTHRNFRWNKNHHLSLSLICSQILLYLKSDWPSLWEKEGKKKFYK